MSDMGHPAHSPVLTKQEELYKLEGLLDQSGRCPQDMTFIFVVLIQLRGCIGI